MMDGEPTSVTIVGRQGAGRRQHRARARPSRLGVSTIVDIAAKKIDATCDLGGQPIRSPSHKDKTLGAIAIENERDEEVNDGNIPQMPAGDLVDRSQVKRRRRRLRHDQARHADRPCRRCAGGPGARIRLLQQTRTRSP